MFCLLGHMYPCTFQFRGGKGILSGGTIAIMIDWRVALVVWGGFLILAILTRYVSLGSCWAGLSFPFVTAFVYRDVLLVVMAVVIGGLILWKHRGNIQRMVHGTESKFTLHKKRESAAPAQGERAEGPEPEAGGPAQAVGGGRHPRGEHRPSGGTRWPRGGGTQGGTAMRAAVIGSGAWGTALALVLLENGHDVALWSYTQQESSVLREKRENPMLKGVALPEELELTTDIACVKDCQMVVLATPSFAVRATARQVAKQADPGTPVVLVSKGIEKETSLLLHQVVEQEMEGRCPVVVLSGPSHAEEVGRHVPTAVVVASERRQAAELVQDAFMNGRLRIYTSPDIVGVEIGAAMKNVIALCAGCCDGMGYGDNTKAMLMTRGLTEIARLGVAMGARKETFAGLTGLGDLIVTCTSMHSRNRRAGILLGQGKTIQQAMDEMGGAVVEGYYAAASAKALAEKAGVEMPITFGAYETLYEGKDPREVLAQLMARQRKDELELEESWI